MRFTARRLALVAVLAYSGCGGAAPATDTTPSASSTSVAVSRVPEPIAAAVAAADRTDEDRALDAGRRPAEVLAFFGIAPGWHVVDVFAGGGYTTELLARVVGPSGSVVAQNNTFVLDRFARGPLGERLARLGMANVTPLEAELDAPVPAGAHDLDAVIFVLSYHDSVWQGTDRAAMNHAIFEALRPGGIYGIVDHAAAPGHGVQDAQSLHRIERSVVVSEVLAAGFVLDGESELLANAQDAHDWNASPREAGERRGTSDRFVLRFRRP